jgi:hypothetical protein
MLCYIYSAVIQYLVIGLASKVRYSGCYINQGERRLNKDNQDSFWYWPNEAFNSRTKVVQKYNKLMGYGCLG